MDQRDCQIETALHPSRISFDPISFAAGQTGELQGPVNTLRKGFTSETEKMPEKSKVLLTSYSKPEQTCDNAV